MYIGNGVTKEFPIPPGADGSVVCLGGVRLKEGGAYAAEGGNVIFNIPPPEGVSVSFEVPISGPMTAKCLVIYPDGTMAQISEDPHELLTEAKIERAETKRLLASALDVSDKLERNVRIEGEIAREKLTSRLEKYAALVEGSVDGAAAAARDELIAKIGGHLAEMRETSAAVSSMLAEAKEALEEAKGASEKSAARAADGLKRKCSRFEEALLQMASIKRETEVIRDEARNAAVNAGAEVTRSGAEYMKSVMEEIRALRDADRTNMESALGRYMSEASAAREEVSGVVGETRRILSEASELEKRCSEMDAAARDRETGMRALWERMITRKERKSEDV
jgi:hypothetical protein